MCNLYRMDDIDWVRKWAIDAESTINLMPRYQMNPDQMGPIVRNTEDARKQLVHARWGLPSPERVREEAAEARAARRCEARPLEGDARPADDEGGDGYLDECAVGGGTASRTSGAE
jgi:putative SOS response-associated peptidase YedK